MPRKTEVTLDELRKIMQEGEKGGYFKWKFPDEINALNYIRLEMEHALLTRERERLIREHPVPGIDI
jgi:hypothetical protein